VSRKFRFSNAVFINVFLILANGIGLCKEVADGLRVYFNFILKDFLLYPEEKEEMEKMMSEDNLKDFKYNPGEQLEMSSFFSKQEPPETPTPELSTISENTEGSTSSNPDKRQSRLRSHSCKTEEEEKPENMSSLASTSSGDSAVPEFQKKGIFSKSWFPLNAGISQNARKIIEETFAWKMIPLNAEPEPSMIFGVYHLTRLVVKLPEFLSATPMNEEKLTMLLKYLDYFVEFLEENPEIYGPQNFHIPEGHDDKNEQEMKLEPSDEDSQDSKKADSKRKKDPAGKSLDK
jgi:male-specific lethal 3